MKRPVALLAVTALFLAGIVVGVLGTHVFYAHTLRRPGGLADVGLRFLAADLGRRLDLTAAQRAEVDRILDDTRTELERSRARLLPELRSTMTATQERIAALLTPEQREEFERFRRAQAERVRRFLGE